jgi:hypothetical protein
MIVRISARGDPARINFRRFSTDSVEKRLDPFWELSTPDANLAPHSVACFIQPSAFNFLNFGALSKMAVHLRPRFKATKAMQDLEFVIFHPTKPIPAVWK